MTNQLPRPLRERLALSALNFLAGPDWRVFASDKGRLWATKGSSGAWQPTARGGLLKPGAVWPDAIDADTPAELAAKLRKRLGR